MIRQGIRRAFRLGRGRTTLGAEVDDEIRLHLELRAAQLVRQGLAPDLARAEALRRFGPIDQARHDLVRTAAHRESTVRTREWMNGLRQDLAQTVRALRREPGFAAVVVLTLALGIGANAAMFGIIDRLLLRGPAHVVDDERVQRVYVTLQQPGGEPSTGAVVPYVVMTDLREGTRVFSGLAAYGFANEMTLGRGVDVERVKVRQVTWSLFPLLGVRPQLGRFFGADEDRPPQGKLVAVLDHGTWQSRFGGDPAIVGKPIVLEGRTFTVVGVAPRGFTGPELEPVHVWTPVSADATPPTDDWPTTRNAMWLQVIGRLAPGVTPERANAEATAAHRRAYRAAGRSEREQQAEVSVLPLRYSRSGEEPLEITVARWLQGVAAVVLLVACANVANLLLAHALRRRREVAVRLALGIGRGRLIRLLLAEGLVLALAGGIAGLLLAYAGGHLLRVALLPNVVWERAPVDARVLAFTALATVLTGLLVGLAPALQATRRDMVTSLKEGTKQSGGARSRLRSALTVAQAALSVVLLVGAGLFVHSLWNVRSLNLGVDSERVLVVSPSWPLLGDLPADRREAERERRRLVRAQAVEMLARIPGVAGTAMSAGTPFRSSYGRFLRVPGWDSLPDLPGGGPYVSGVTSDYFATAGTRVLRGRGFTPEDRRGSERVAVVNETMARTLWPGRETLGQCIVFGADTMPCSRIVGVVEDVRRFQLREEPAMQYYLPLDQSGLSNADLLVRAAGDPTALAPAIRRELRRIDPTLGYIDVKRMQEAVDPQVRPWRLGATMFGLFGALALLVASIGLYSVMAYTAAQRTHEMGVRLALGARPADVGRLVVRSGTALAALGVALGVLAALVGGRWAEPLLFDVSPRHPAVFGVVVVTLLLVAVLASLVPAWRASRVAPSVALRAD